MNNIIKMKGFIKVPFALAATLLTGIALANGVLQPQAVGEVSLVLGKAWISGPAGDDVLVTTGVQVHAGDAIETDTNGHVHIRFVDDALVSVRPSSTLEVVRYDYNAQNPQNSAVKLNLVEGVSRAISGEAAKHARQNFRMNTPIAAIGVRGTDFAVSASAQSVRAVVNQGAIVVAPFSTLCSADSLGPCSQDAVELSGLSRQILEISASTTGISSALLPAGAPRAQVLAAEVANTAENAKTADSKEVYADSVTSRVVNTTLATSEPIKSPEPQPTPAPPPLLPPPPPPPSVIKVPPEFTPAIAESAVALTTNTQLVWGRWIERSLDSARVTVSYEVAIENGRKTTVGNLAHALFRVEPAGKSLQPGLGVLAFNLAKAQAHFKAGGQIELMQVGGGELKLDFNQQLFSTNLQLSHAATGNITFSGNGRIFEDGIFRSNNETQSMAGAVSFDGKEAGYFFEKSLSNGAIEGLTLWNVKP